MLSSNPQIFLTRAICHVTLTGRPIQSINQLCWSAFCSPFNCSTTHCRNLSLISQPISHHALVNRSSH